MPLPLWAYPILFLTGITAGIVDSLAGGGGLIALPVLLMFRLPAPIALGTNKLQSMFGTASATRHYARSGAIDLPACWAGAISACLGSLVGALTVQSINAAFLSRVIPFLMAAIFVYMLVRPTAGTTETKPRFRKRVFYVGAGLTLGFYDGFFGPGVGSFWTISLILGLGFEFLKATGTTKLMNVASNVAATALFALGGHVLWLAGLTMAAGQITGARIGAGIAVKKGSRFVRPLFLTIVGATLARLIYLAAHAR